MESCIEEQLILCQHPYTRSISLCCGTTPVKQARRNRGDEREGIDIHRHLYVEVGINNEMWNSNYVCM